MADASRRRRLRTVALVLLVGGVAVTVASVVLLTQPGLRGVGAALLTVAFIAVSAGAVMWFQARWDDPSWRPRSSTGPWNDPSALTPAARRRYLQLYVVLLIGYALNGLLIGNAVDHPEQPAWWVTPPLWVIAFMTAWVSAYRKRRVSVTADAKSSAPADTSPADHHRSPSAR